MKKLLLTIIFLSPLVAISAEEYQTVRIDSYPSTVEEFVEMRNVLATTPEGGAACFVVALLKYTEDKNAGKDFLTAILTNDGTQLRNSRNGYGGKEPSANAMFLVQQIDRDPWTAASYIDGTSPENRYMLPEGLPWTIATMRNVHSEIDESTIKVFVRCSGADTPRPITLVRNNRGIWKAKEWSSLVVDIVPPVEDFDDDL